MILVTGMPIDFEWTVKFGDLLTVGGAAVVAASILHKRGRSEATSDAILTRLVEDFREMKEEFKTFSSTMAKVATQESQIALLMKWYDELRRGIGFVRGVRGIDHEYGKDD